MAFKLDDNLLQELGLAALPLQEKQAILRHILETLEMRVGTTLAAQMTDQQLDDFERLMPTNKDTPESAKQKEQQALGWLESNFPHYRQVVNNELEKLKIEIKQSAPQILATSQAALQQPQTDQQFVQQPVQPTGFPPNPEQQPASFSQPPQPYTNYQTSPQSPPLSPQDPTQPTYGPQQQPPYPQS